MLVEHVRVDADGVRTPPIDPGVEQVRRSVETHRIARDLLAASPKSGDRMCALALDHALIGARKPPRHFERTSVPARWLHARCRRDAATVRNGRPRTLAHAARSPKPGYDAAVDPAVGGSPEMQNQLHEARPGQRSWLGAVRAPCLA